MSSNSCKKQVAEVNGRTHDERCGLPPTWPSTASRRQKSQFSTNIWLSDLWLVKCKQQLRRSTMHFTTQTATHQWSCLSQPAWTTYEENRTEFICTQL